MGMPTKEEMICITCPMGCRLTVTREGSAVLRVEGNSCKKGQSFAEAELTDPRRMVATTVQVRGAIHPLIPVYTETPFPKPRIAELLDALRGLEISAPVSMNQVVLENALNTGINVIASRDMTNVAPERKPGSGTIPN
jgi:CxxC motif-containing protein